ncbi:MAG: hypothetical protein ACE5DI_00670 [Candidatus Micrarchaeia archaeon]
MLEELAVKIAVLLSLLHVFSQGHSPFDWLFITFFFVAVLNITGLTS